MNEEYCLFLHDPSEPTTRQSQLELEGTPKDILAWGMKNNTLRWDVCEPGDIILTPDGLQTATQEIMEQGHLRLILDPEPEPEQHSKHVSVCPNCGQDGTYMKHYDNHWCHLCHIWLEPGCADGTFPPLPVSTNCPNCGCKV